MSFKNNPYYNGEGCPDPTAYHALNPIVREETALNNRANFIVKVLNFIANEAGFDIMDRIKLKDRKTGRIFK